MRRRAWPQTASPSPPTPWMCEDGAGFRGGLWPVRMLSHGASFPRSGATSWRRSISRSAAIANPARRWGPIHMAGVVPRTYHGTLHPGWSLSAARSRPSLACWHHASVPWRDYWFAQDLQSDAGNEAVSLLVKERSLWQRVWNHLKAGGQADIFVIKRCVSKPCAFLAWVVFNLVDGCKCTRANSKLVE